MPILYQKDGEIEERKNSHSKMGKYYQKGPKLGRLTSLHPFLDAARHGRFYSHRVKVFGLCSPNTFLDYTFMRCRHVLNTVKSVAVANLG